MRLQIDGYRRCVVVVVVVAAVVVVVVVVVFSLYFLFLTNKKTKKSARKVLLAVMRIIRISLPPRRVRQQHFPRVHLARKYGGRGGR